MQVYQEARIRRSKAQQDRTHHEQVELRTARERDRETAADAIEAVKQPPAPAHERKALDRLDNLTRAAEAAQLVEQRTFARFEETLAEHEDLIAQQATERLDAAKARYLAAVGELASASVELSTARGLDTWRADRARGFKVRALKILVPGHGSDALALDAVIAGLREAPEPVVRRYPSGAAIPEEPTHLVTPAA